MGERLVTPFVCKLKQAEKEEGEEEEGGRHGVGGYVLVVVVCVYVSLHGMAWRFLLV